MSKLRSHSEKSINTAFVLNGFTPYISVFTNGLCEMGEEMRNKLQEHGYPLYEQPIQFLGKTMNCLGSS